MKTIGIIGGMGPLATVDLYSRIVKRTKAQKDQEHIHILIDSNSNIPDRTKAIMGDCEDPTIELIKSAQRLEQAGADFLIMPCNTAHFFINEIIESVNIPFINMVEETVKYTFEKFGKDKVVGIMAADGAIKTKIYENYYNKMDIKTVIPEKTQNKIMEFIYDIIKSGKFEVGTDLFFECVKELEHLGAEVFLLGCTELSSAQFLYRIEGPYINPMEIITETSIIYAGGELN